MFHKSIDISKLFERAWSLQASIADLQLNFNFFSFTETKLVKYLNTVFVLYDDFTFCENTPDDDFLQIVKITLSFFLEANEI